MHHICIGFQKVVKAIMKNIIERVSSIRFWDNSDEVRINQLQYHYQIKGGATEVQTNKPTTKKNALNVHDNANFPTNVKQVLKTVKLGLQGQLRG